jgi:hypothetical protein
MTNRKVTVAQYVEQQIALSNKTQKQIADEIGYDKANIITMIKTGATKLPINKVGPLARALHVDPAHLLRLVMEEYLPETWETIQGIVGQSLLSDGEVEVLRVIHEAAGGIPLERLSDKQMKEIGEAVRRVTGEELKRREASARTARTGRTK